MNLEDFVLCINLLRHWRLQIDVRVHKIVSFSIISLNFVISKMFMQVNNAGVAGVIADEDIFKAMLVPSVAVSLYIHIYVCVCVREREWVEK